MQEQNSVQAAELETTWYLLLCKMWRIIFNPKLSLDVLEEKFFAFTDVIGRREVHLRYVLF